MRGDAKLIMRTRIFPLLLALALLGALCACAARPEEEPGVLRVTAATYPVYLFATAVTEGVEGVEVALMVNQPTSCLHNYTLSVKDMKALDRADVVLLNGAGLEEFMADALAQSDAAVVDCSKGIALLPAREHGDHDHEGRDHEEEFDPHFWMDPRRAAQMVETIAAGLSGLDPDHAEAFRENRDAALAVLEELTAPLPPECGRLITFHDGFQYFADAFGLELLRAVEEEEGASASAREIVEITELVEEYRIPAVFVEKNGSSATAEVISRETGCGVFCLDMIMSGEGTGIRPYADAVEANLKTVWEALG